MIIILILGCGLFFVINLKKPEDNTELSSGTSVARSVMPQINNTSNVENYRYTSRNVALENKRLKDTSYGFLDMIEMPMDMFPQGICFSDEYLFVSMYSADKNTMGIVMIFDKRTNEYVLSMGMDSKSHLGGIAFDGSNLWICNSSKMSIERISYELICKAIDKNVGEFVDIRNLIDIYPVSVKPSCITFYDGRLWVAAHSKLMNSQMMSYVYLEDENRLEYNDVYSIPSKVQGIDFDEDGSVILSTSYGRKKSSYLKIYHSAEEMSTNVDKYVKLIEMPPCSEEIAIENGKYYIVFESASIKYLKGTDGKGKTTAPLDRILIIDPS